MLTVKTMRRIIAGAALALLFGASPASAQSGCTYIVPGAVLTAGQWNACFQTKQDYLGFVPINPANLIGVAPVVVTPTAGIIDIALSTMLGNGPYSIGSAPPNGAGALLQIIPTALSMTQGLSVVQSSPTSGNVTAPFNYNYLSITNQENTLTTGFTRGAPSAFFSGQRTDYFTSGTNISGEFQAAIYGNINALSSYTGPTLVGIFGHGYSNVSNANTGAAIIGVDGYSIIDNGGSIGSVHGLSAEVGISTGGAATYRAGVFIDTIGTTQGTTGDAAIMVSCFSGWNGSNCTTGSFQNLIMLGNFSSIGGSTPLTTTANLINADTAYTIADVIHLPTMTCTNILNFASVVLGCSGQSLLNGTATLSSTTADSYFNISPTVTVAGNNQSIERVGGTITGTNTVGIFGVNVGVTINPTVSGTIAATSGAQYIAIHNPGAGTTITTAYGADIVLDTGSGAGAITTGYALGLLPVYGSIKPTTAAGLHVSNMGASGITTSYGLQIDAQSGSTTNYGFEYNSANPDIIFAAGGLSVGTTTDPGTGVINALNGYDVNGVVGTSCTLTTVSHLTVVKGIVTLCN